MFLARQNFSQLVQSIINDKPVPEHGLIVTRVKVRKTQGDRE